MRHRLIVVGDMGAVIRDCDTRSEALELFRAAVRFGHRAKLVTLPVLRGVASGVLPEGGAV